MVPGQLLQPVSGMAATAATAGQQQPPAASGSEAVAGSGGGRGGASVAGLGVMPGTAAVVDMIAQSPGEWELQCATLDHASMGMRARLVVGA